MADRHGPIQTGLFRVEIDEVEVQGWRRVEIPSSYTEIGEYREGDDADHEKKVFGQTTFDDLEMERGVQPGDHRLFQWREQVRMGDIDNGLKEVTVTLLDEEGESQFQWEFQGAWIKEYHPPALEASSDEDILTESIVVAFDKIVRDGL